MTERLKRGDYVRVRLEGSSDEWTPAFVALAGGLTATAALLDVGGIASVLLMLDGPVRSGNGIFCNALPLTIDYEKETVISLMGDAYEIEVRESEPASARAAFLDDIPHEQFTEDEERDDDFNPGE